MKELTPNRKRSGPKKKYKKELFKSATESKSSLRNNGKLASRHQILKNDTNRPQFDIRRLAFLAQIHFFCPTKIFSDISSQTNLHD